jgi:hypothetical protein
LIALGKYSPQLKYDLIHVNIRSFLYFFRKLDATLCSQFTDAGFLALAQVRIEKFFLY